MDKLEAFNLMRAGLGLPPISSTATASRSVATLEDSLSRARKKILRKAYPKFGQLTDLIPNGSNQIVISQYLRVIYPEALQGRLTEKYGMVWDIQADAAYSESISGAWVISDIAFDDIDSESWQEFISYEAAVLEYQRNNDPDGSFAVLIAQRNTAQKQAYNESRKRFSLGADAMRGFYR